jgi:hypothetical protein
MLHELWLQSTALDKKGGDAMFAQPSRGQVGPASSERLGMSRVRVQVRSSSGTFSMQQCHKHFELG